MLFPLKIASDQQQENSLESLDGKSDLAKGDVWQLTTSQVWQIHFPRKYRKLAETEVETFVTTSEFVGRTIKESSSASEDHLGPWQAEWLGRGQWDEILKGQV